MCLPLQLHDLIESGRERGEKEKAQLGNPYQNQLEWINNLLLLFALSNLVSVSWSGHISSPIINNQAVLKHCQ